jgi:hypothetical protein
MQELMARGQAMGAIRTDLPPDLLFAMISGLDGAIDTWFLESPERLQGPDRDRLSGLAFAALRGLIEPPVPQEESP